MWLADMTVEEARAKLAAAEAALAAGRKAVAAAPVGSDEEMHAACRLYDLKRDVMAANVFFDIFGATL
jgi:hypothetical protein